MTSLDPNSPLQQAVQQMAARTVTGSPMTSREWGMLPAELRMRSMFSARVEHERTLAEMQDRITAGLAGEKREGVAMDRARFVEEMQDLVRSTGYKRPEGTSRKGVQNLRSRARLELIWNMNVAQARGYAKWLADMTPESLENEPAYELVRIMARREPRDWPTVWRNAGGKFYDGGRMIAPKTDGIWITISRFGTPWAPFDWGSGMGLAGIDIDEAEALGAVPQDAPPQEPQQRPFNADYSMSAAGIPEDGRQRILTALDGEAKLDGERFRLIQQGELPPAPDRPPAPLRTALRAAATLLESWSEAEMAKLAAIVTRTTAWQRWAAAAGSTVITAGLVRAVAQFLAGPDGAEAIAEMRATQARDQYWCQADFAAVAKFLKERGGE